MKCISLFQFDIWMIYAKHLWTDVSNGVRIFSLHFSFLSSWDSTQVITDAQEIFTEITFFTYQHHETLIQSLFVIELIWILCHPPDKPRFSLLQLLLSPEISPSHILGVWVCFREEFRSIEFLLNYNHPALSVLNKAEFLSKWRHFILSNHQETTKFSQLRLFKYCLFRMPPPQKTLGAQDECLLIGTLKLLKMVASLLERKTVSQVSTYSTNERQGERGWPGSY